MAALGERRAIQNRRGSMSRLLFAESVGALDAPRATNVEGRAAPVPLRTGLARAAAAALVRFSYWQFVGLRWSIRKGTPSGDMRTPIKTAGVPVTLRTSWAWLACSMKDWPAR